MTTNKRSGGTPAFSDEMKEAYNASQAGNTSTAPKKETPTVEPSKDKIAKTRARKSLYMTKNHWRKLKKIEAIGETLFLTNKNEARELMIDFTYSNKEQFVQFCEQRLGVSRLPEDEE